MPTIIETKSGRLVEEPTLAAIRGAAARLTGNASITLYYHPESLLQKGGLHIRDHVSILSIWRKPAGMLMTHCEVGVDPPFVHYVAQSPAQRRVTPVRVRVCDQPWLAPPRLFVSQAIAGRIVRRFMQCGRRLKAARWTDFWGALSPVASA